jgi:hypothetical protein
MSLGLNLIVIINNVVILETVVTVQGSVIIIIWEKILQFNSIAMLDHCMSIMNLKVAQCAIRDTIRVRACLEVCFHVFSTIN